MFYVISLAARVFDPGGTLLLTQREGSDLGSINRRVSRTATLDGGAAVVNRGYSPADRTVILSLKGLPASVTDQARRLLTLHNNLTISIPDGCYHCTIASYNERQQTLEIFITGTA